MTEREKRDIIIDDILQPSLCRLYEMDYDNIRFGVSERNICGRLAHHMENIMREFDRDHNSDLFIQYFADVEYNRMGNGELKRYENSEHLPQYMVADLLIQSRGEPRNLLAVEMKRSTNYVNRQEDRERLEALVSPVPVHNELKCVYGTLLGAFIVFSAEKVAIEFYEDLDGRGTQTGKMEFACRMDGKKFLTLERTSEIWEHF
jgi:hypothetical protein